MEALEKMVDVIAKLGEVETNLKMHDIQSFDYQSAAMEDTEKQHAHQEAASNEFLSKLMNESQGQQFG